MQLGSNISLKSCEYAVAELLHLIRGTAIVHIKNVACAHLCSLKSLYSKVQPVQCSKPAFDAGIHAINIFVAVNVVQYVNIGINFTEFKRFTVVVRDKFF